MSETRVLGAACVVDGRGSVDAVEARWRELRGGGARTVELTIDPLAAGWDTPLSANHFRSGCAPIEALAHADALVRSGGADAVIIRGEDLLRTTYAGNKAGRTRLMTIYGEAWPIPEAYTLLARAFMQIHGVSAERFRELAGALFENYLTTAHRRGDFAAPRAEAFARVTELFRLVDCANPVVDFAGALIVGHERFAAAGKRVTVAGVGLGKTSGDGPAHAGEIARYDHLKMAFERACEQAGVKLAEALRAGNALLEVYTCYPVAPLGFLLASCLARSLDEVPALLASHEITVTGGMNLARAPWNCPALHGLIAVCERLWKGDAPLAAVHGNGGLGYRQGVAILRAE